MSNAPVCNVTVATPKGDPKAPKLQNIPKNSNMQQMIQIINNNFNLLLKGNFVEDRSKRTFTINRVFDPQDNSIYVDVQQITGLTFVNPNTGQTIQWHQ